MMGKHSSHFNFDESRVDIATEGQCIHFDYSEVDAIDEEPCIDPTHVENLADTLREILTWLTMGDIQNPAYGQTVMRKTIAMCWVMRPELFQGKALSEIAKASGIKVYKQSLSKQAIKFSQKFGIKGRGQRKKYEDKSKEDNRSITS